MCIDFKSSKLYFTYRFAISVLKLNFVVPLIFQTFITFD